MGIEAFSRGFTGVSIFEKNMKAFQIIKTNCASMGLCLDIHAGDSLKLLNNTERIYDVAYLDPPYASGIYEQVFNLVKNKACIIIAEHSSDTNIPEEYLIKSKNYGGKIVSFYSGLR